MYILIIGPNFILFIGSSFLYWILYVLITWNLLFLIGFFIFNNPFLNKKLFLFQQNLSVISYVCCNNRLIFVCMKFSRNSNHILCILIMKTVLEILYNFLNICITQKKWVSSYFFIAFVVFSNTVSKHY